MAKSKIDKIKTEIVKEPKKPKKVKKPVSLAKTVVGDHLTVITDENGKDTLVWDWDKLSSHVGDVVKEAEQRIAAEKVKADKKAAAKEKRLAKKNATNI